MDWLVYTDDSGSHDSFLGRVNGCGTPEQAIRSWNESVRHFILAGRKERLPNHTHELPAEAHRAVKIMTQEEAANFMRLSGWIQNKKGRWIPKPVKALRKKVAKNA